MMPDPSGIRGSVVIVGALCADWPGRVNVVFDATGRRTAGWQLADAPKPSLCHQAAFVFVVHRDAFDVHAVGNVLVETPSGPPRPAATDRLGRLKTGEHAGPHKRDDEARRPAPKNPHPHSFTISKRLRPESFG